MTYDDVAIVVTVYPSYADLLAGCLAAFERYWPGHPRLMVGKSTKIPIAERLLADVRAANAEFVLTLHEDFYLCLPVKQHQFDLCLEEMRMDSNLVSCSLTWEPCDVDIYHFPKPPHKANFQEIPREWDYTINFQIRIWRRAMLLRILAAIPPGTTNGTFEPLATQAFRRLYPQAKVITYAFPDPDVPSTFVDRTDKSHWIVAYKNVIHAGIR